MGGRALVVSRATGRLHHFDRLGTEIWRLVAAASPAPIALEAILKEIGGAPISAAEAERFLRDLVEAGLVARDGATGEVAAAAAAGSPSGVLPEGRAAPRQRRLDHVWQVALEIEPAPGTLARRVGEGFLLRSPDGALDFLAGDAATLWERLAGAPRSFVDLLDALCDRHGHSYDEAASIALARLASWTASGVVRGLEHVEAVRAAASPTSRGPAPARADGRRTGEAGGRARRVGRLELMDLAALPAAGPSLGWPATLRDGSQEIEHVAIVCQYGIHGLAPGVEPYTRRSIERLRSLRPDLVILSGGGRHGLSPLREAESVIDRYLALLPDVGLWLEKHSETTWENLERSLELLQARSVVPRRITLLGDRARVEKLRLACWFARRRFAAFGRVRFRVVPVRRPRFTWRDRRSIQLLVGPAQIVKESRGSRLLLRDSVA